jgi:hypothetical protein
MWSLFIVCFPVLWFCCVRYNITETLVLLCSLFFLLLLFTICFNAILLCHVVVALLDIFVYIFFSLQCIQTCMSTPGFSKIITVTSCPNFWMVLPTSIYVTLHDVFFSIIHKASSDEYITFIYGMTSYLNVHLYTCYLGVYYLCYCQWSVVQNYLFYTFLLCNNCFIVGWLRSNG